MYVKKLYDRDIFRFHYISRGNTKVVDVMID